MARIRTIKPDFWDDSKIGRISRDSRLLYIAMWNFSDDLGVISSDILWLKSKIFPFDQIQNQQFERWLNELVKNGFISLFSHNGEEFYYLPNLTRHQIINRPNYDKVFIKKTDLESIIKSLNNHGIITERSLTIKDKEEDKEYKKESPNGDKKESSDSSSSTDYQKFIIWMRVNAPYCSKNMKELSEKEFVKLKEKYTGKQVAEIIEQIENRKDLRKRYSNLYKTILNWAKREYGN